MIHAAVYFEKKKFLIKLLERIESNVLINQSDLVTTYSLILLTDLLQFITKLISTERRDTHLYGILQNERIFNSRAFEKESQAQNSQQGIQFATNIYIMTALETRSTI